jgi:hypothetical protein
MWIMETLSVSQITGTVFEHGKYWAALEIRQTTEGTTVIKSTLFDHEKILGHYIFDSNGQMLVATEILEFQRIGKHILPLRIKTSWNEEDISMTWNLGKAIINSNIDPKEWVMPKINPKFELGR